MQLQDGFIVGIYNYCDRWCQACPFTARCRVFTDTATGEASLDPAMQELVAPVWMTRLVDGINAAATGALPVEEAQRFRPKRIAPEHHGIRARADAYAEDVHIWLGARGFHAMEDRSDPRAIIRWFHTTIPPKVVRALKGLANQTLDERDGRADADGSAKVALLGIDQSHAAFLQLVERRQATHAEIQAFVSHLVWLGEALERVFPQARAFVRPAFDEPAEVARLAASLQ